MEGLFQSLYAQEGYQLTVDLENMRVTAPDGGEYPFEMEGFLRHQVLNGLDDIDLTLEQVDGDSRPRGTGKGPFTLAVRVMSEQILLLSGDGIGPEVVAQARLVLERVMGKYSLDYSLGEGLMGGAALDDCGQPLPEDTLARAREADAILLGAVGGPKWDGVDRHLRPEKGLLAIRSELGLFGNLRPAKLYPQLVAASTLRPEVVGGLDILIVRELTGASTSASRGAFAPWTAASARATTPMSIGSRRSSA